MKDKELYDRIAQFEGYPIDYQSNLITQQKLIEDSVNTPNAKIQNAFTYKYISLLAVTLVALVSIAVYFSVNLSKKEPKQLVHIQFTASKAMIDHPKLVAKYNFNLPKRAKYFNLVDVSDTHTLNIDTNKTIVYQSPVIAFQVDTIVPQKGITMKEQTKLFAKRQRIKQFDFESKVNPLPVESSVKKMEYFVMKDGQFKIFSRNKNQILINHF